MRRQRQRRRRLAVWQGNGGLECVYRVGARLLMKKQSRDENFMSGGSGSRSRSAWWSGVEWKEKD